MDKTNLKSHKSYIMIGTGAALSGLWGLIQPDVFMSLVSDAWRIEAVKMTFAFTLAAWMHRTWVKKDMSLQFDKITDAINNVAITLRQDLEAQTNRLVKLEDNVGKLSDRVENLEKPKRGKKNEVTTTG